MLKRTISGACFVAIIAGFFLLRELDYRLFHLLTMFFMSVATFEVARAVQNYAIKPIKLIATIFGVLFVPQYAIIEYFALSGMGFLFAIDLILLFVLVIAIYCIFKNQSTKTFLVSIVPIVYPALLILTMLTANDLVAPKGFLALLLIFVISPCSDTMAYLVGMTYSKIKKGNVKRLCPRLSPKKTVAGAIGGTIGGALGGLIVYFVFRSLADTVYFFSPLVLFIIVGVVASILTIVGDLTESYLKRKVGIKDMGKIMPGHGGIMDRIDGISVASVFIFFIFLFV